MENTEAVDEWSRVYVVRMVRCRSFLNILTFAEAVLQTKLTPLFFILQLTTYIILKEVEKDGSLCKNPLWLGRVRKFYPQEYEIGEAHRLIAKDLKSVGR